MTEDKDNSELLLRASAQGFNISIHGIIGEDGNWKCAVEKNEIIFPDFPGSEEVHTLEQERVYNKTKFEFSFDEAFRQFDESEWFLCHPIKIHDDFADLIWKKFEQRISEYKEQNPAGSPTEEFLINSKIEEWKSKVIRI